ncbi:MAG: hypothetical protein QM679_03465 [Patulibacter sp.]
MPSPFLAPTSALQRRFTFRQIALLSAVASASSLPAAPARAATWPKRTVTYRDTSPWGGSLAQAVAWINEMPGNVRLQRAARGHHADVTIRSTTAPYVAWAGETRFWSMRGIIFSAEIRLNRSWYQGDGSGPGMAAERAEVTVHELLHALGLPHAPGCSVMRASSANVDSMRCGARPPAGKMRCGPQRADAFALVARYGGRVGNFDGFRCADPNVDAGADDDDPSEETPEEGSPSGERWAGSRPDANAT